jgi:carbohydrate-selective porin OprB
MKLLSAPLSLSTFISSLKWKLVDVNFFVPFGRVSEELGLQIATVVVSERVEAEQRQIDFTVGRPTIQLPIRSNDPI